MRKIRDKQNCDKQGLPVFINTKYGEILIQNVVKSAWYWKKEMDNSKKSTTYPIINCCVFAPIFSVKTCSVVHKWDDTNVKDERMKGI